MEDEYINHLRPKQRKKENDQPTAPFSPVFHFEEFKVGSLENASTINIGNNYPTNFKGIKRHNQGLGTIHGDNNDIHDLESHLKFKYFMDAFLDEHHDIPDHIKQMMELYVKKEFGDTVSKEEKIYGDIDLDEMEHEIDIEEE